MLKIGDRVRVKLPRFFKRLINQTGIIVRFDSFKNPIVLFDNKELNTSSREDGAFFFYEDELELYTIDQTKRNLLDE